MSTYIYNTETDYYAEYQSSVFALTTKKGGWDCLRHYEILANGAIPIFPNIENCHPNTMKNHPKDLYLESNALYSEFLLKNKTKIEDLLPEDLAKCKELAIRCLEYVTKELDVVTCAKKILEITNHSNAKKVLYMSCQMDPDYLRCLTLLGFKELMGSSVHDYPKVPHLYIDNPKEQKQLYGKGISYTNLLLPELHDNRLDNTIEDDIRKHQYDVIIYGSLHRGMIGYDLVSQYYSSNDVIIMCGEDVCNCLQPDSLTQKMVENGHHVFLREWV